MGARQLGQDDDKARRAEGYEKGTLVGTNLYVYSGLRGEFHKKELERDGRE
jgi:hypothetical protein